MSVSVSLPALGESVTEGTVTRWLKAVTILSGECPFSARPCRRSSLQWHGFGAGTAGGGRRPAG